MNPELNKMHIPYLGLILGYQLCADGSPSEDFKASMALATRLLQTG